MLGQNPVVEHVTQPGGKGFLELNDESLWILGRYTFYKIFKGIAAIDHVLIRHDHVIAEDKIVSRNIFAITPFHIVTQFHSDGLAIRAQTAIFRRGNFRSDLRYRLVL